MKKHENIYDCSDKLETIKNVRLFEKNLLNLLQKLYAQPCKISFNTKHLLY